MGSLSVECCGDTYVERCSFETDLCNWSQMDDDDMDWAWLTGNNGQQGGAPGWDHTTLTSEGSYLYLYSLTGDENKVGRLGSVVFLSTTCMMRFWYHMYGENVNRLSILTKVSQSSDFSTKWMKSGSQGEGWKRGEVILDDYSKFQVFIEGVAGISFAHSDHIAIDDISFTPGCQVDPENTLPISVTPTPSYNCETGFKACKADQECILSSLFCDFKFDCDDGSDEDDCPSVCDFEDDMCGWYQDPTDDTNWHIYDSSTTSSTSAPITDHTTNHIDGQYVYVDGTLSSLNQHARLISPTYGQTGNTCSMSFWYYLFGDDYGKLSVILTLASGGQERVLAEITIDTDNTNKWVRQDVIMPVCVAEFQIILDALNLQNYPRSGGFAVDDIRFDTCEYTVNVPLCGSGYSKCTSGQCYPTLSQCDFTNDCCQDASDELACDTYERCFFDYDMCSWKNMVGSDELDWSLTVAETSNGPSYDHTTDSKSGIYIITGPSGAGDKAQLNSLAFTPVIRDCYIRLFVFLDDSSSSVNIFTRTLVGGPLTFVWGSSGSNLLLQSWVKLQVPITSSETFEVVVEAILGSESGCTISVDDISFTPACVPSPYPLPSPTTAWSTSRPLSTTTDKEPISPTDNGGGNNKVIFIVVGVVGGLILITLVLVFVVICVQRQRQTKGDNEFDGIGNPAYVDTQMNDDDKDGFTNAGFAEFGEGEA
ncbi:MAM and LDL-receptor class A domain-containing protein 1 [Holothuria leucospilota]|uniref:MAM and LDL-receptor class A domain-containing protein 1 n=1 Tax=Holothuria leucospilota TaxID=206669 RepID=A0A9Q1CU05_HOLLE|nr:MAM and LDL-receptor class A domain-containing protein 1 [Holothuria leucospilota]